MANSNDYKTQLSYNCEHDFLKEQEFFVMTLYKEELQCSSLNQKNTAKSNFLSFHQLSFLNILSFVTILIFLFGLYTYLTYKTSENPLIDTVSASSISSDLKNVDFILNNNKTNCESLAKSRLIRICDAMMENIKTSKNLTLSQKSELLQKVGSLKRQVEELDMQNAFSDNITRYKDSLSLISLNLK